MLKRGDKVYRVCEYDRHDGEPESTPPWRVESRTVKSVGKVIKLKQPFRGVWRQQFPLNSLGIIFHETEADALRWFHEYQDKEIAALERHKQRALDAKAWAFGEFRKAQS